MLAHLLAAALALPATPKKPAVQRYHGVKVSDDYRWLENDKDAKVEEWSEAQNAAARAFLDDIPWRESLRKRMEALVRETSPYFFAIVDRKGRVFAEKFDPKKQQPFVVLLDLEHPETARPIVDPNLIDPSGRTAIDFWVPSLDGKKIAVSLSKNGSESGDLHLFDVARGKEIDAPIPHVNHGTAGGSVAWNAEGSGFWYTRYPRAGERKAEELGFYQQVYFHKLGADGAAEDSYELGKELPRIAEITLETSEDGQTQLASVKNGDGGDLEFFLRKGGRWSQISRFEDRAVDASIGLDGAVYLLSRKDAPKGKILRLPMETPELSKAAEIVPEGEGGISGFLPTAEKLYVRELLGGPSRVRAFPLHGGPATAVNTPEVSAVHEMARLENGDVLLNIGTYLAPPAFYRLSPQGQLKKTKLQVTSIADYSDCEVVRDFATSKDGTKVPLNIIRRKGTELNGRNPTLLYGYGGYSLSETPSFSTSRRVWIDAGGVFVDANLRGGGEYGDAWHKAGNLTHKQNVFDDFYAVARYLVEHKYTDKDHLAIYGGSNGGLLMGAELTQHPGMWKAVASIAGVYDMLRVEETPNGAFNVTEYGTVKDPEQFKALYAYSPYHHVKDGTAYPATLFMTGANDPRVDPWHSRKMVARLQAANRGRTPILLRTSSVTGHGMGSSLEEVIAQRVDLYAFIFKVMGLQCCVEMKSVGR
jgi:prolyl oligopeptidase